MPRLDRVRVLIVDDISDTRDNLRKLLFFERDLEVVGGVGRGEEAIQKARELRPDVVLMDINLTGIDGIAATEAIRAQTPSAQVIMMSVQGEPEYLRRAMLAGAREFLVKPFSSEELASSIRRVHALSRDTVALAAPGAIGGTAQEDSHNRETGQIVAVFGAKGGVGRTTVACNLAVALHATTRKKVAVVDGSLEFGDVGVVMNVQGGNSIADLIPHAANLETELVEGILIGHPSGVRILQAPPRPEMAEAVSGDVVRRVLGKLRECYDFVVVDTASGLDETVLVALDLADKIVLLLTLEMPALKNTKIFLQLAKALGYTAEKILLVVNRVDNAGGIQVADVEESLKQALPIRMPNDARLASYSINRGVPLVTSYPESALAKSIFGLAHLVSGMSRGLVSGEAGDAKTKGRGAVFGLALPVRLGLGRRDKSVTVSTS